MLATEVFSVNHLLGCRKWRALDCLWWWSYRSNTFFI